MMHKDNQPGSTSTSTSTPESTDIIAQTLPAEGAGPATGPDSTTHTAPVTLERSQNFSFASNYQAVGRFNTHNHTLAHHSLSYNHKFSGSQPAGSYNYKPISAFTVLSGIGSVGRSGDGIGTGTAIGLSVGGDDQASQSVSFTNKPNAIVRPIRRPEQPALPTQHGDAESLSPTLASQGTAAATAGRLPIAQLGHASEQNLNFFAEELNRKLRYLHSRKQQSSPWTKSLHSSQNDPFHKRPLFITTVPTGVFLPPAKEIPLPSFLRPRIYAFSSQPMVLNASFYSSTNDKDHHRASFRGKGSGAGHDALAGGTLGAGQTDMEAGTGTETGTVPTTIRPSKAFLLAKDKQRASIAPNDKEFMLNSNSNMNAANPAGYSTPALAGGVHLTKQQFRQQVQQNRAKREVPVEPYKNVMHDKRVIRGSNFAGTQYMGDTDPFDKAAELRRRNMMRKKCRKQRNVLGTPPPVAGRSHEVVQTDRYLEELCAERAELSVDTQTDLYLERPPTPPYKPAKVGVDAATEIADGELFHFDAEAQPIIDVLVDSCIEQSMLEVAHQREIEKLREKQNRFLAEREAELAKLRRLEAEERRLQAEKERRIRQDAISKELDDEMQKSVTAAKLLQGHIASLLPEVLENIEPATDATKKDKLMNIICPWLSAEVAEEVGNIVDSREILTVIIEEIIKQRAEIYAGYTEELPELPEPLDVIKDEDGGEEEGGECELEPCASESIDSKEC